MSKVYVVTSGCYSDYHIDGVYSTREAAEKRCAAWDGYDDPMIEEYELDDGSNIEVEHVYRSLNFNMRHYGRKMYVDWDMKYGSKPFEEKLCSREQTNMRDGRKIELYYGSLSVNKTITTDEEAEKIIYDRIAKRKAEQMGL